MADNALKVTSLEPKYGHNRITNARFIQGGYFVVEKFSDLSSKDLGITPSPSVYADAGTIVVGSLCYCQENNTRYVCTEIDTETDTAKWEVDKQYNIETEETEKPTENLVFNLLTDDTLEVSGKKDEADKTLYTDVVIPATHKGEDGVIRKVTKIAGHAFDGCSNLTTVVIPDSITFIDEKAFHNCTSLEYVEIPPSVTNLGVTVDAQYPGGEVFKGCSSLKWVSIPQSVKTIGFHTFLGCTKAQIYTEWGSKPAGWYADDYGVSWNQSNCDVWWSNMAVGIKDRTTISLQGRTYTTSKGLLLLHNVADDTYTVLGIGACADTDVVIPPTYRGKRITSINVNAFASCTNLRSVVIAEGITTIGSGAFANCTRLESVTLPFGLTEIGSNGGAFRKCSSLVSIDIPSSVAVMGISTFDGCVRLATIFCGAWAQPQGWSPSWNSTNAKVHWGLTADSADLKQKCSALETAVKALESNIDTIVKVIYSASKREDFNDNILWPQLLKADNSTKYDWLKYIGYVTPAEDPNLEWGEYM